MTDLGLALGIGKQPRKIRFDAGRVSADLKKHAFLFQEHAYVVAPRVRVPRFGAYQPELVRANHDILGYAADDLVGLLTDARSRERADLKAQWIAALDKLAVEPKLSNGGRMYAMLGKVELARLDDDGNGWVDEADAAWSQLRLWSPDAEGKGRLQTLNEAGVGAFHLGRVDTPFSLKDAANDTQGLMRASSIYLREDGRVGTVSQVDLRV